MLSTLLSLHPVSLPVYSSAQLPKQQSSGLLSGERAGFSDP